MNSGPTVLSGSGMTLREWSEADLGQMVRLFDEPEVARRTPLVTPFDDAAARTYLSAARAAGASGARLHLAMTRGDDLPRGEATLNLRTGSIAYVVGSAYRGQGLASGGVTILARYAADVVGLTSVHLEIEADNAPSCSVARKAGFRPSSAEAELVEDKGRTYALFRWVRDL